MKVHYSILKNQSNLIGTVTEGECNHCRNDKLCKYLEEMIVINLPVPFTIIFDCEYYVGNKNDG